MIKFEKFNSSLAWIIYVLIILSSISAIHVIDNQSIKLNNFSIVVNVISIIGFLITINQLMSLKETEKENNEKIKEKLDTYFKTIMFQDFASKYYIIDQTQSSINNSDWEQSLIGLRKIFRLIDDLELFIDKYEIEIKKEEIINHRRKINQNISEIEKKMKYSTAKITTFKINENIREIGSMINKQMTVLKSQTI